MEQQYLKFTQDMLPALKSMADNSNQIITWALSLIGGSILTIINSSYIKPPERNWRFMYFLFIPGWVLMGLSLYNGNEVPRRYNAAQIASAQMEKAIASSDTIFVKEDKTTFIKAWEGADNEYANQITLFQWGLCCFILWLVIYLAWWLYARAS